MWEARQLSLSVSSLSLVAQSFTFLLMVLANIIIALTLADDDIGEVYYNTYIRGGDISSNNNT